MARDPGERLAVLGAPELLDIFVRLGLGAYVRRIDVDEHPLKLIVEEADETARSAGLDAYKWPDQIGLLMSAWDEAEGPLARLSEQLSLKPPDLFLLGLTGGCERHRSVAMAVGSLQAPYPGWRPSVHLALDLCATLFEAAPADAMTLAGGSLVSAGVVTLEGDDALPRLGLAIRLPAWRALQGGPAAWPGGRSLGGQEASGVSDVALSHTVRAIKAGDAGGVVLRGPPGSGRADTAAVLAARLGMAAIEVPAPLFRDDAGFGTTCRAALWMPVIRIAADTGEAESLRRDGPPLPCAVLAGAQGAIEADRLIDLAVRPPTAPDRAGLWRTALGPRQDGIDIDALAAAVLYPPAILRLARSAVVKAEAEGRAPVTEDVVAARRRLAPDTLRRLAHPVERAIGGDALIMNDALAQDLAMLIGRCRRRESVWDGLGPSLAATPSRGVRALFTGDSGTGKTIAAAYVATTLGAPLYRCDLAAVMNKYIGESEKNLGNLLDYAEAADVILLFDEADALFGRRTDAAETGERYANMLTNFLLTRIEAHNGIILLTANGKARIDPAFWRRLDQVIDFPTPGYGQRVAIWKSHLGSRAPEDAVIHQFAAYSDLAGGSIRNAVLAAAAMVPGNGPIDAGSLLVALRREYSKLGRSMPAALAAATRPIAAAFTARPAS